MVNDWDQMVTLTNRQFVSLKKLYDTIAFMVDTDRPTHDIEDKIRPLQTAVLKDAAALEARGYTLDRQGF